MHTLASILGDVTINPTNTGLPGFNTFQGMINGVAAFALLGCLAAAIIGGVIWAFGASSSNVSAASKGQKTVGGAVIGALIIGASAILINFFYNAGKALN